MLKQKLVRPALAIRMLTLGFLLVLSLVTGLFLAPARTATAATDNTVNFQARLMTASGGIVPDGNYNVEFKLYNALSSSGSSQGSCTGDANCLWTETRISGNQVHVVNGYLTVNLGSVTAFPGTINWDQDLYLGMNIGGTGTATWDGEMTPRLHLTAVPYAFRAGQLATLNGSNAATLTFTAPTASRSIVLPDASGTVCLQAAAACGFLTGSASNYIQNTTSVQSANMYIQNAGATTADTSVFRFGTSQTGDAIRVLNSAGTSTVWEVQPSIVAQTVPLQITAATLANFTTPLGSAVSTAINIPLMNPGAHGQILSFGLPSTADVTSRAISVFDARTSGVIQPAISLFSPNENDAFGLSWNGLTTVGSLETLSGAIALRPGGVNTQLYTPASGGVAIGANFQSPGWALDVLGDINASSSLRIGGTSVCDTVGSTGCIAKSGSGYYIHNQTTVQTANAFLQSASSSNITEVLQGAASQSVDILDVTNSSNTVLLGVTAGGKITLQNTTVNAAVLVLNNTDGTAGLEFRSGGSGGLNTFVGVGAGSVNAVNVGSNQGIKNTAVGVDALQGNTTGQKNAAFGYFALQANTSGSWNTGIGDGALSTNISGTDNTALGVTSLFTNSSGSYNVGLGENALFNATNNYNTAVGYGSLQAVSTGTYNTALGYQSNVGSGALTNATAIGANATVSTSNSLVLGGTGTYAVNVGIGTASPSADLSFGGTVARTINVTTSASNGFNLTVQAGSAGGTNKFGGDLILSGGAATGSGTVGSVLVQPAADTDNAFDITSAAGTPQLDFDTTAARLNTYGGNITINGVANIAGATSTVISSGGSLGTGTYNYMIAAIGTDGSYTAAVATLAPAVISSGTTNRVTVAWTTSANAAGYAIFRSINGGANWFVNTVSSATSGIIDNGTTYTWATAGSPSNTNSAGGLQLQAGTAVYFDGTDNGAQNAMAFYNTGSSTLTLGNYNANGGLNLEASTIAFRDATQFHTNFSEDSNGNTTLSTVLNSTTAFRIQKQDNATTLFNVDTSAEKITIGPSGGDTTGMLLILGDKTGSATDPTGTNGAMYYNATAAKFRCYENGAWYNCLTHHIITLGADVTNNNATANTIADVTGLSFAVASGTTYHFHASILYTAAATTTGSRWSINGPTTSLLGYTSAYSLTATTQTVNYATAYNIPAASNATSATTTGNTAILEGMLTPSAAGTVIVRSASSVASSAIVAKAGSTIEWW